MIRNLINRWLKLVVRRWTAYLVLLSNAANIANIMNLVTYLRGTMHMGVAEASTTASNFFAALQMFSIPAAFLADSYIKRFYTILIFGHAP